MSRTLDAPNPRSCTNRSPSVSNFSLFDGRDMLTSMRTSVVLVKANDHAPPTQRSRAEAKRAGDSQFLDLFGEDSRRNVYGPELEVRPPAAPTTQGMR